MQGGKINIPDPLKKTTAKDEVVLEYVDNFRRQFVLLYPDRPSLFLCPKNEYKSEKFITTYIRPTKLQFKQLYEYLDAASFVADHLIYAPLSPPPHTARSALEAPPNMMSPTYVLEHRAERGAHCFEYATLLVSLLIGVGYDAYCVSGYASKQVTINDLSQRPPPFPILSSKGDDDSGTPHPEPTTYESFMSKKPYLQSQFIKSRERKQQQEEEEKQKAEQVEKVVKEVEEKDPYEGHRIHCWVLILPGKREVDIPMFIEPTTGQVIPNKSKDYKGIEAVWNDNNYWVNMQNARTNDFSTLSYDLANINKWEPIFLDPDAPVITKPINGKASIKAAVLGRKEDGELAILRCPTSWVPRIEISKHEFLTRFPNGEKSVDYKLCTVDRYADYHRNDGMVMHVTMYSDDTRTKIVEYRDFFGNRKDFLEQRRRILEPPTTCEIFGRGRAHGLKEYIETDEKRELVFSPATRIDGLVRRVEFKGKKTAETYEGREDHLIYRSVTFSNDPTLKMESIRLTDTESSLPMRKITEKFERNPSLAADDDVQKITFAMDQKKIIITYHRAEGRITAAKRIYTKEGKAKDYQVDPFATKPTPRQLHIDFQKITSIERDCIQKLRDTDREATDAVNSRIKEENNIELTASIHDTWRGGKKGEEESTQKLEEEGEGEGEGEAKKVRDPLAIFMHIAENKPMSRELALHIKESALRTLKDRLIQKANLIHSRLEKETAALSRLQANHQHSKDNPDMPPDDDAEYKRLTYEATFRIRILEERLARHEKLAVEKFQELDAKIVADPRVSDFL